MTELTIDDIIKAVENAGEATRLQLAAALFSETTDIEDDGTITFEQRTDNHLAALTGLARIQAENIEALTKSITVQGKELRAESVAQGKELRAESVAQGKELRAEIAAQGKELRAEIAAQGKGLRAEIAAQGKELRAEIAAQGENIKALTESITMQGEELRAEIAENRAVIETRLVSMGTNVGALSGIAVESALQSKVLQTLERRLKMVEPVILVSMQLPGRTDDDFKHMVDQATTRDRHPINPGDKTRILETDLIIEGRHSDTMGTTYLVVEASHTIQAKDISQVIHTRTALQTMMGTDVTVTGAVFGINIGPDDKRLARASALVIYEVPLSV